MPSRAKKYGSVQILVSLDASIPEACTRSVARKQNGPLLLPNVRTLFILAGLSIALVIMGCSVPPASVTAKLTSGISVSAPLDGADVTSPFIVTASANTCESQPVVSMSYSIDGGQLIAEPASFKAEVTAAPGPHVLHVKCLGHDVSSEVLMSINVASSPTTSAMAATPSFSEPSGTYSSTQAVSISSATTGSTIYYTHNCKFDGASGDRSGPGVYKQWIGSGELCDLDTEGALYTRICNQSARDPAASQLAYQA
jgi:hypothetical protein